MATNYNEMQTLSAVLNALQSGEILPKVSWDLFVEELVPLDVLQVDVSIAGLGVVDFHEDLSNWTLRSRFNSNSKLYRPKIWLLTI